MSDEQALLAAIWAHPHEDTPRLMYADWLQENGRPERAKFIRLQCELARTATDDPRLAELQKRESGLWNAHRRTYRQGLPERLRGYPFHRGFVAPPAQRITGHRFHHVFLDLLPCAPIWAFEIRSITAEELGALFAADRFRRIGSLGLAGNGGAFGQLTASPHACNLTELDWGYSFAGPAGTRALCSSPASRHLAVLRFDGAEIGDEGAAALADFALPDQLVELDLRSNKIGERGITRLFGAGRFEKLARLDLSYNGYPSGDAIIAALVRSARLPALRQLRLFGMGLTTTAAQSLAAWSGASVQHLDLSGNIEIRAAGVRVLAESPHLRNLVTLDVFPSRAEHSQIADLLIQRFGAALPSPRDPQFTLRGSRTA
jgi:uncharacterized protein (TIGR02996 family)